MTDPQTAAINRATALFSATFSHAPTIAVAAPGRVNLIGEHVDYNDGFVFPLALEKNTYILASPSPDNLCHVVSEKFPAQVATFAPGDSPVEEGAPKWTAYLKGMTALYERNNIPVQPFQAVVVSDVPLGGGLSSSAALEMATGVLLEALNGETVDPSKRALMGQECEQQFAGVPCGIMDQLISSRGVAGHALLIDCRTLDVEAVPLDDPEVCVVIANSKVTHELSGSEYPTRRKQCAEAARVIAEKYGDYITHLRDCDMGMLENVRDTLDQVTYQRAKHAIEEDVRTLEAKKCLIEGDLVTVGVLMYKSHASLRDLFEVSTTEIDHLVEIARGVDGVYGSRITGGGFGGCTVSLVKKSAVKDLFDAFEKQYPVVSGGVMADVFDTRPGVGARNLSHLL